MGQRSAQQHVLINFASLHLSACSVVFSALQGFRQFNQGDKSLRLSPIPRVSPCAGRKSVLESGR